MLMNQKKTMELLKKYSIPLPKQKVIKKYDEIKGFSFPVALKVDSPDVIHKSDLGLVYLNIETLSEVKEKIAESTKILQEKKISDYSFVLQEMAKGQEIIIGMKRDDSFGPVILFGLGGIFVEVLKDVSMMIAPLSKKNCIDMINGIKGRKLLDGYRGRPKVSIEMLVDLLMKLSKLSMNEKEIKEIDFNPVMIDEKKCVVVDARVILDA